MDEDAGYRIRYQTQRQSFMHIVLSTPHANGELSAEGMAQRVGQVLFEFLKGVPMKM